MPYAVAGGVDCDRLIKEVPAKVLHYKEAFVVGGVLRGWSIVVLEHRSMLPH